MVNVVARSPSNVDSAPAVITVDGVAPAAPVIDPSNGTEISGTAEAGATVILTDGGGNPIGQATADGSGNWTFTPGTPLANGTVINAVAQDPAGHFWVECDGRGKALVPGYPQGYCENHYIHSFELENGRIKRNREFMNPIQKLRALGIAVPQIKRDGIPT